MAEVSCGLTAVCTDRDMAMGKTERERNNPKRRKRQGCAAVLLLAALCCAGCGEAPPEDDRLLIMEQEAEKLQYDLAEASIGDVVLTERVACKYTQKEEQEVSFSVSGRQISQILVRSGDSVSKGQLLAVLADNGSAGRIDELEYRIARNRLLLEQVDENENNELSARWLQFLYRSGRTAEEEKTLKDSISRYQQDNEFLRQDYRDAIELDGMELENLRREDAAGRLYAGMNGTVSWVRQNLEGSTCARGEVIMRLIDGSEGLFVAEGKERAALFQEGVPVRMNISVGTAAGDYELLPYDMEEWDDKLFFSLPEEYDVIIDVGTMGTIKVILDSREGVLGVPASAVHKAEDRFYVYVVGEGGLREVRWVETGLFGDDRVEIKKGLEQGEKVILR